jgi:hypothetical protein
MTQDRRRRYKSRKLNHCARLSMSQILAWADSHHARTGRWPQVYTGAISDALPGEKWRRIDNALRYGLRGLPGGSSLTELLSDHRGIRNTQNLPALTEGQILAWVFAHHRRTGMWPNHYSGVVQGTDEVWGNLDACLRRGSRGLSGGSSLAKLLANCLGVRTRAKVPRLSVDLILGWADAHYRRTGMWPTRRSGLIAGAPGETWRAVDIALHKGRRGLSERQSLPQFLAQYRGVRNLTNQVERNESVAWSSMPTISAP